MSRAYATAREGKGSMSARWISTWAAATLCAVVGAVVFASVASATMLPDGRFYEQVTPEEKYGGEVYQPPAPGWGTHYEFEVKQFAGAKSATTTQLTFQAAADGDGVAYVAAPTVGGNENSGNDGGNEYLAQRTPSGEWSNRVLSPENAPDAVFQAFSPNLTTAFVDAQTPLSPLAPGFGESPGPYGSYDVLYSTDTEGDEFAPLFSTKPPHRAMGYFGTAGPHEEPEQGFNAHRDGRKFLALEGMSADDTHLLFAANDALTAASEGRPAAEGGEGPEFEEEDNLYESVGGRLRLVNVLPNGTTHVNATFGAVEVFGAFSEKRTNLNRVISADGSRIFWTDLNTGHIYMREDGTRTVEISPEGTYQTATADGSKVFYTNGDLYSYDVASGDTTDLTPGVAVEQVVGSSENGEYIYYLTSELKLVLWHDDASNAITSVPVKIAASLQPVTAEVTPDGQSIAFTVEEEKEYPEVGMNHVQHVDVYDAETETLYCASCTSQGSIAELPVTNSENVYQPRWMSTNGAHVFFISVEGLVPQDTNETQDVYEWERPGTGGCAEPSGCVYLLSGGISPAHSGFLDASESGEDVFIVTRANLTGSDEDGLYDLYDVRVGEPRPTPPTCTGTGCQGLPSAPPSFATPSSVTFEGVENFVAAANESNSESKPKKTPKHKQAGKKGKKGKKHKAADRERKKKDRKKRKGRTHEHTGKGSKTSKSMRAARAGARGGRS